MKIYPKNRNNIYYSSSSAISSPLINIITDNSIERSINFNSSMPLRYFFDFSNSIYSHSNLPDGKKYYHIFLNGNFLLMDNDYNIELICSVSITDLLLYKALVHDNVFYGTDIYKCILELYPELFNINIDSDYYLLCKQNKNNLDLHLQVISTFIRDVIRFGKEKDIKLNYIENHKNDLIFNSKLNEDELIVPKLDLTDPEKNKFNIITELNRRIKKVEDKVKNFQLEFNE